MKRRALLIAGVGVLGGCLQGSTGPTQNSGETDPEGDDNQTVQENKSNETVEEQRSNSTGNQNRNNTSDDLTSASSIVKSSSFQLLSYDESPEDPRGDPQLDFDTDRGQIRVTGRLFVGSGNCKKAILDDITYNDSEDNLEIVISHGRTENHPDNNFLGIGSCNEEMSSDGYEVTVMLKNPIAGKFTAIERDAEGIEYSETYAPEDNQVRSRY